MRKSQEQRIPSRTVLRAQFTVLFDEEEEEEEEEEKEEECEEEQNLEGGIRKRNESM